MWSKVIEFENRIADFYGSPYAVAIDCCTHALELVLRLKIYSQLVYQNIHI